MQLAGWIRPHGLHYDMSNVRIPIINARERYSCYNILQPSRSMELELLGMPRAGVTRFSEGNTRRRIVFYECKQEEKSGGILDTVDDQQSSSIQTIIQQAEELTRHHQWQAAVDCCDRGLELAEDSRLYNLKARALGKLGRLNQQLQLVQQALRLDPANALYHRSLGAAHYKLQHYVEALASHKKALELQPDNATNLHNVGAVYYRMGDYVQASLFFGSSLRVNKHQMQSHRWLGNCYRELGDLQKALQCYYSAYSLGQKQVDRLQIESIQKILHPWRTFFNSLVFC